MELKFRDIRADEVECRVAMVKPNGVSLLLYKDARVDQNILDETVGCLNWQRHHTRDNANCIVSIWDDEKKQWIEKEDTGKESNTEAEKGLASDSFKRACFNFGIGRELYTAPFIWINAGDFNMQNGKCCDKFKVTEMTVESKVITSLKIANSKNIVVYTYKANKPKSGKVELKMEGITISEKEAAMLKSELARTGISLKSLLANYGASGLENMNLKDFTDAMSKLKAKPTKEG